MTTTPPPPEPLPECNTLPLEYKTWQEEFCEEKAECSPEAAFARAVGLTNREIERLKARLLEAGFELLPDLQRVRETSTGKVRPAQDALTRLVFREGRAGALPKCQAHPEGKVSIRGQERSCQSLLDEITRYLQAQGFVPTGQANVFQSGTRVKTLTEAAKELDMQGPNLLKTYQSAVDQLRKHQQNYNTLLKWFQEGLRLAEHHQANPLAPVVGCYATKQPGLKLCITQDPVEIALKSTGRPWQDRSCERITGIYRQGFIDDIAYHNAIAFAVRDGKVIGRKMIRWGLDTEKITEEQEKEIRDLLARGMSLPARTPFCAGVEPIWYETEMTRSQQEALEDALAETLECYHLVVDTCITPYPYRGYSDAIRQGKVPAITYARQALGYGYLLLYNYSWEHIPPMIFHPRQLSYSQANFLLQHDFEVVSRTDASFFFYSEIAPDLAEHIRKIKDLDDLMDFLECDVEEKEKRTLTLEQEQFIKDLIKYLPGKPSPAKIKKFLDWHCLPYLDLHYLFQAVNLNHADTSLYYDELENRLFTPDNAYYMDSMDDYVRAYKDIWWEEIEQHFAQGRRILK